MSYNGKSISEIEDSVQPSAEFPRTESSKKEQTESMRFQMIKSKESFVKILTIR